jgi:hypothetical protein
MQTYILLLENPEQPGRIHAVEYAAPSAHHAVQVALGLQIPGRCELWTEGCFVCSLKALPGNRPWLVASNDVAVDIVIEAETGS